MLSNFGTIVSIISLLLSFSLLYLFYYDLKLLNNKISKKIYKFAFLQILFTFLSFIILILAYVISDFNYGEIWQHKFELIDGKITKITFKDAKNIDLLKFSKPKI